MTFLKYSIGNSRSLNSVLLLLTLALILISCNTTAIKTDGTVVQKSLNEITLTKLDGQTHKISNYSGDVILLTNIALKCGTTSQLKDLESLYRQYRSQGFVVLGFPSNDFTGAIEPTDSNDIKHFCTSNYGVSFPLYEQASVKGKNMQPLFEILSSHKDQAISGEVEFNFEKFLVDRSGEVRFRYGPFTSALSRRVKQDLETLLKEGQ